MVQLESALEHIALDLLTMLYLDLKRMYKARKSRIQG